jgi:hypothetical protein
MIQKAIVKAAKKVIADSGLSSSTRSGSKELSHWATYLAQQPFSSLESAQQHGQALGQKIVERSQSLNRQHLDAGIIRQLRSQKDIATPSIAPIAASSKSESNPVEVTPMEVNVSESMAQPMPDIVSIPVEKPESTEEAASVGAVEDEDVIPVDPELAKVQIDPNPHEKTAAEEPKSVVETVAQAKAIADPETAAHDINADDVAEVIESEKNEVTSAFQ